MEELMGETSTYLIGLIGVLVGTLSDSLKQVIKAFATRLVTKINKSKMDNDKHELYNAIDNHLSKLEYTSFSTSLFKDTVIKDRERLFWCLLREELKGLNLDQSLVDFEADMNVVLDKVDSFKQYLVDEGMPEKVVDIMEKPVLVMKRFLVATAKRIISSNVYDTNSEKLWIIQSLYLEYINIHHEHTIEALVKANGSLQGEKYKGLVA